jgi:pimeloyl-ACP methyl ester carboxylesterase
VTAQAIAAEYINVRNIRIWVAHGGEGQPLLYLPGVAPEFDDPALSLISQDFHVYRPHHPGFGRATRTPRSTPLSTSPSATWICSTRSDSNASTWPGCRSVAG